MPSRSARTKAVVARSGVTVTRPRRDIGDETITSAWGARSIGYVRWTEGRNFEAVVDLMESGKLNVRPLITHRFPIEQAAQAYAACRREGEGEVTTPQDHEALTE